MELFLVWTSVLLGLQLAKSQDFSYKGSNGPDHWGDDYSKCNGKFQSPINLYSGQVKQKFFPKLQMFGELQSPISGNITNNGHTVVIQWEYYAHEHPKIYGGPLNKDSYRFVQMHFHWGKNNMEGSEDRINNMTFPGELHVVWHNTKYKNFDEAAKHSAGIVVFAFFLGLDMYGVSNPVYEEIIFSLGKIHKPYTSAQLNYPMHLLAFFEIFKSYFTYNGSLTTPPCSEDVIWLDFESKIILSEKQMDAFRHLLSPDGTPLIRNFRPLQPSNDRPIYYHAYDLSDMQGIPFVKSGCITNNAITYAIIRLCFMLIIITKIIC